MNNKPLVVQESIENKILLIRGKRVMLDRDLASLYGVETRIFNQAVKRNMERFPVDFMFRITKDEYQILRSQNVISSDGHGGSRYLPYAFGQEGVAMLSSVLNSKRAVEVNIQIMRVFIKLRELMISNRGTNIEISNLKQDVLENKKNIKAIFSTMNQLISPEKHTVFALSKTNLTVVNQEIQEALNDLNRKPKPDITGAIQHATAAVECVLRNITGENNATLGQILKKRKDIIPPPLNISVEKAWGYASDRARHVREGVVLDYSEAEFVVTQFVSVANFLVRKFKAK